MDGKCYNAIFPLNIIEHTPVTKGLNTEVARSVHAIAINPVFCDVSAKGTCSYHIIRKNLCFYFDGLILLFFLRFNNLRDVAFFYF